MKRLQFGFGPFGQLGEVAVGGESAHRIEDLFLGGEVGEGQTQTV